ncbi:DUF1684 domain-containing protein [Ktedonobacter robiniae]|uniref:DUF1684 domain-containing protein n=1 Tax=Ktedonobacter robiniae TaxID=2778365 RepID=A0ABQ3URH8_9CHLR|nr:DUF1684 domain-containing protein [Ktedonobacter robiniae]GHO55399.1 hypothetical protein KSB_38740 [Ktedonobacter robiniae]
MYLDLYDYRLRVQAMYRERNQAILAGEDAEMVWQRFHQSRDALFAQHSQSALDAEQRRVFSGLRYFPYNPALRFAVTIETDVEPQRQIITMSSTEQMTMLTVGRVRFTVEQEPVTLHIYWLDIYGGGLFLPFRDLTSPEEAYGGGRYLFDTIKGSDWLPVPGKTHQQQIMLDFNYAYNPSCAYNDAWMCPLAPRENQLRVPLRAGELRFK